jgi:glycosyltransferase involved in cell wall biosynthesis
MTSISVLVPVFDEEHLVAASLERLKVLETSESLRRVQVIVVDDCSRDATQAVLQRFAAAQGLLPGPSGGALAAPGSKIEWLFLRHERNGGKGKAIQTALARADCELTIVHDADLEYHPRDIARIVTVFEEEGADAVFGSRFAGGPVRRVLLFRHELGNRFLTFCVNLVTNLNLTDMETCYKAVRTDLLKSIPILSNDFRIEPELTIKLAKRQARIFEVPISYSGRTYNEGKKINWRDGFAALWAVLRFAVSDAIYTRDAYGSEILGRLARAPRFNAWMADTVRPLCGSSVLEIGSGTGNLTRQLIPRKRYVASDVNPLYLQALLGLQANRPYLRAQYTDVTQAGSFPTIEGGFDTVICLNVVEHVDDDRAALRNIHDVLAPGGRAIILVPQGQGLFGSLDEVLGHRRRYSEASLRQVAGEAGFRVREIIRFNRIGTPAWWLNGKVLKRRTFGLMQILTLNALTPIFRRIDRLLPFPSLSLIAVMEPDDGAAARGPEGRAQAAGVAGVAGTQA